MDPKITDYTADQIVSVYSGKDGKCACGCSGIHRYRDAAEGTKSRGYTVDAEEVNPAFVRRTFAKVQAAGDDAKWFGRGWSITVGERMFAVYVD